MKRMIIALAIGLLIGSATTALAATSDTVQAVFAEFKIMVNGQEQKLNTAPLVVDGTSYLPVREVADLLGAEVGYDDATRTITFEQKESEKTVKTTAALTDQWIALRDISKQYPGTVVTYGPKDGHERVLFLENGTLKVGVIDFVPPENSEGTLTLQTTNGEHIQVKFSQDTSYLSASDLKKIGF